MLLFDVDGVLVNNSTIGRYIEARSVRFLQRYPKIGKNAYSINKRAYKTLGHTSLALGNSPQHVMEYNDYVFNQDTLNFVRNSLTNDDLLHINKVGGITRNLGMPVGLCTNTPLRYCESVLFSGVFTDQLLCNAFTSDTGLIKPNGEFYDVCETDVAVADVIYFLDDSMINIDAVRDRENWYPLHVIGTADLCEKLKLLKIN